MTKKCLVVIANCNGNFIHATRTRFRLAVSILRQSRLIGNRWNATFVLDLVTIAISVLLQVLCLSNWQCNMINYHLLLLNRETRITCFLVCIPKVQISHFLCFEEVFLASFAKLFFVCLFYSSYSSCDRESRTRKTEEADWTWLESGLDVGVKTRGRQGQRLQKLRTVSNQNRNNEACHDSG